MFQPSISIVSARETSLLGLQKSIMVTSTRSRIISMLLSMLCICAMKILKNLLMLELKEKLDVRADHTRYPGENGRMIKGINDMLDAYIGPINVSAEYIDRISKGDPPSEDHRRVSW